MKTQNPYIVLSFYDYTGNAVRPWAMAGAECHIYDILHPEGEPAAEPVGTNGGAIIRHHANLFEGDNLDMIAEQWRHDGRVVFMSGFPPCTHLAVSGARWWAKKAAENPAFQTEAAYHAARLGEIFDRIGADLVPYYIENPVGALSRLWRKPNHKFDPVDYSGYLPKDDVHPRYPQYIPARDAYTKKTCLWAGGGFRMPTMVRDAEPTHLIYTRSQKGKGTKFAPMAGKLGGTSQRTKDIRSETPRGFATAVFEANAPFSLKCPRTAALFG
jgi:hypothetical protein